MSRLELIKELNLHWQRGSEIDEDVKAMYYINQPVNLAKMLSATHSLLKQTERFPSCSFDRVTLA